MRTILSTLFIVILNIAIGQNNKMPQQFSISNNAKLTQLEKEKSTKKVHFFVEGEYKQVLELVYKYGGHYKYQIDNRHGVLIPAKHVRTFIEEKAITNHRLDFSVGLPLSDTMLAHMNVYPLHNQEDILPKSFKGKDVIVGIIDTGIDFSHPDLQNPDGSTRVLYLWDQANGADDEPTYGYGHEWDSAAINAGTCTHTDPGAYYGHGTSVAALATSNGQATEKYPGVAPESDIIFVASDFSALGWTQTVADAVEYIINKANTLGRPCVINTSLGTYYGSHDGLDDAAQMIDGLLKAAPGRAIVASAGNAGTFGKFHLSYDVSENDTNFTWFQYNSNSSYLGYGAVFFELWADTADFNYLKFAVGADKVSPNYEFRGRTGFHNIQDRLGLFSEDINVGGNVLGSVDTWAEIIGGQYFMQVHMYQPDSSQYNFRFMTTGTGTFDVWSTENNILDFSNMVPEEDLPDAGTFPDIARYQAPDSMQSIVSSWTCLPSVITVGNYMNRDTYLDYNSVVRNVDASVPVGEHYPTSSRGPNRLGDVKPNVIAPGNKAMTASVISMMNGWISSRPDVMDPDGMHRTSPGGTSSAAPVVSGTVALLLERCPTLTYSQIIDILQNSAKVDAQTGVVPNIEYGYGKVDAYAAFKQPIFSPHLTNSGDVDVCNAFNLSTQTDYDFINWSNSSANDTILINQSDDFFAIVQDGNGCYDFTDTVSVNYVQMGDFDISYTDTIICIGNSTDLALSTGYVYLWSNGATIESITPTASGSFFATVTSADLLCSVQSDTVNLTFDYLLGDFDLNYNDTILCIGETATVSVTSGYNYLWNNNNTTNIQNTTTDAQFFATVTDGTGCTALSDTISVRFDAYQLGNFPILYDDTIACVGNPVILRLPPGYFYNWSDTSTDSVLYAYTSTSYYATVINANGCIGYSDTVNTYYDPYLLGDFTISKGDIVCSNEPMVLSLPPGYTVYNWSNGKTEDTIYVSQDGQYYAELINAAGCTGFSDTVDVYFYIAPPVPMINNINDTLLQAPLSANYQWYLEGVPINNDTLQSLRVLQSGNYSVEVFHANGCSEFSDETYIDYISGLNSFDLNTISIYPNPSNGNFVVSNVALGSIIVVYDITGKLVEQQIALKSVIEFDQLSKGTYILEVSSSTGIFAREKVVVK